jgi:hypothetical protein
MARADKQHRHRERLRCSVIASYLFNYLPTRAEEGGDQQGEGDEGGDMSKGK